MQSAGKASLAALVLLLAGPTLASAQAPAFTAAGVLNAATSVTPVVAGGTASIYGTNLAISSQTYAGGTNVPTTLNGTSVKIGGFSAPLYFVSAGQINLQIPWEVAGLNSANVTVTTAAGTSAVVSASLAPFAPVIYTQGASAVGAILNPNGVLNDATHPTTPGSIVEIGATDLGPVQNQQTDGAAPSGNVYTSNPVAVTIGGVSATVFGAVLCNGSSACPAPDSNYLVYAQVPNVATNPAAQVVVSMSNGAVVSNTVTINVAATALSISSGPNFGSFQTGPIDIQLQAAGGSGTGYTWSISAGSLPPGMAARNDGGPLYFPLGTTAGLIGVATTPGTYNFTIQVTDSANNTATKACTMKILTLAITDPTQFPDGFVGSVYPAYTPVAVGATGAVTWSIPNNNLPSGLSINQNTGAITGTPNGNPGNYGFNVSATDSTGTTTRFYNIQIWGVNIPTPGDLGTFNQGSTVNTSISAAGGSPPYTFSGGGLPPGLSFSQNGSITGTITGGSGTFRFNLSVTDHNGNGYNKNFIMNVITVPVPPTVNIAYPLEDATLGEVRNFPIDVNGGRPPYAYTITSGSLPPGLVLLSGVVRSNFNNLGPDDAIITGSSTALGSYSFTLNVKDSSPTPYTVSIPMTINVKALTANFGILGPTAGLPYSTYIQPVGATTNTTYTPGTSSWTIVTGTLPVGLTLNTSTGVISGTPTGNGNSNVFMDITAGGVTIGRYVGFNIHSRRRLFPPQISFNGLPALPGRHRSGSN